MQFYVPRPLLFNRVSLDARGVRLGTGLESRSSFIFYPFIPKTRLTLPLERFSHMNVHEKLRSRDTVQPPLVQGFELCPWFLCFVALLRFIRGGESQRKGFFSLEWSIEVLTRE